jgi:RHS repeat-associated protein
MISGNGTVVWSARYDSFGLATVGIETVKNNLRFPGQYFDQETGLHYNWHRFYDPETGRYVSADPIGLEGGINLYAYVANDPVNWVDPWGLEKICTSPHANGIRWLDTGNTQIKYEIIKSLQIARFVIGIRFSQKGMDGASEMADKFTSNVYVAWEYFEMEAFSAFTKVCYLVECGEVIGGPFFEDSFESTGQKKWEKRWRKGFVLGD